LEGGLTKEVKEVTKGVEEVKGLGEEESLMNWPSLIIC
jgi:hypothetical protein